MLRALAFKSAKELKAKIHGIYEISEIPFSVINIYDFTVCKQVKLKRAVASVCSSDTNIFRINVQKIHSTALNFLFGRFSLNPGTCGRGFHISAMYQKVWTTSVNL